MSSYIAHARSIGERAGRCRRGPPGSSGGKWQVALGLVLIAALIVALAAGMWFGIGALLHLSSPGLGAIIASSFTVLISVASLIIQRVWERRRQAESATASLCQRWVLRRGIVHDGNASIEAGGRHAAESQDGHQDLSAVGLVRLLPLWTECARETKLHATRGVTHGSGEAGAAASHGGGGL